MHGCFTHMHACVLFMPGDYIARSSFRFLRTGVTGGSEPSFGCWEQKSDPLEDHPELLITEPSLMPEMKCSVLEHLATMRS